MKRDWSKVLFTDSKYWVWQLSGAKGKAKQWVQAGARAIAHVRKTSQ